MGDEEAAGEGETGLAIAAALFSRENSVSGAVRAGLGVGIGAIPCTCDGAAVGVARARGSGAFIFKD